MIPAYLDLRTRIQQELADLDRVVARVQRAMRATQQRPEDQDLYLDSVALNLHDFYAGLERIFRQIAVTVDGSLPTGNHWHQKLLQQMQAELPQVRPPVLSQTTIIALDEFLRFRHVLRNIYAFQFDLERLTRLVNQLHPLWQRVQAELLLFVAFLEQVAQDD
jgi:hypothetical protein